MGDPSVKLLSLLLIEQVKSDWERLSLSGQEAFKVPALHQVNFNWSRLMQAAVHKGSWSTELY